MPNDYLVACDVFQTSSEHKSLSDSCGYGTQGYNANEDATSEAIYANLPFQKGEAPLANYDNSEDIHSPDQQQYIAFPYVDDPTFGSNNASRRSRLKPSSHHSNSRSQSNASNSIGCIRFSLTSTVHREVEKLTKI